MAIERRGTGRTLGLMLRAMSEAITYGHATFIDHNGTPRTETALRLNKRKLEDLCDTLALNIKIRMNVADWCLDLHATPYMHGKPLE